MVSMVVLGGSVMRISTAGPRSTMRARTGSGRRIAPVGAERHGGAGWLGGTSTGRPSESVGSVTPSTVGIASRGGVVVRG